MATFTRFEDELKRCPYNPLHKVSARRFAQHVIKCAKVSLISILFTFNANKYYYHFSKTRL